MNSLENQRKAFMLDILNEHRSHKLDKYLEGNDMVFKCLDCEEILFIAQDYVKNNMKE